MASRSLALVDAMVLVDGVRHGFLEPVLGGQRIGVAEAALRDVRYYRDDAGEEHPIDLGPQVEAGRLALLSATPLEIGSFLSRSSRTGLGEGEIESLALVIARGHRFCAADRRAVKAMKEVGILGRWLPLEDLPSGLSPPLPVPEAKYSRAGGSLNRRVRKAPTETGTNVPTEAHDVPKTA